MEVVRAGRQQQLVQENRQLKVTVARLEAENRARQGELDKKKARDQKINQRKNLKRSPAKQLERLLEKAVQGTRAGEEFAKDQGNRLKMETLAIFKQLPQFAQHKCEHWHEYPLELKEILTQRIGALLGLSPVAVIPALRAHAYQMRRYKPADSRDRAMRSRQRRRDARLARLHDEIAAVAQQVDGAETEEEVDIDDDDDRTQPM